MTRQSPSGDTNSNNSHELWPTFDLEYMIELVDNSDHVFIQSFTVFKNPFSFVACNRCGYCSICRGDTVVTVTKAISSFCYCPHWYSHWGMTAIE